MIFRLWLLVIVLPGVLISCNFSETKKQDSPKIRIEKAVGLEYNLPFDTLLTNVDTEILGIWGPPIRMAEDKYFLVLYSGAKKYYNDFISVLTSKEYKESEKMICIFAAQKLELHQYVKFTDDCVLLFKRGVINEDMLYYVCFPDGWKTKYRFAENYNNEDVKRILTTVLNIKSLSKRTKVIVWHMYTGEMWKEHMVAISNGMPEE